MYYPFYYCFYHILYKNDFFFFIYRQGDENYTSSIQLMYLFYFIHYTYFWKQYNIMIIRCVYHLKNWNCLTFLRACKTCFCFVQKMCLMCCCEIILILRKVKFHFLPDRLLCILFFFYKTSLLQNCCVIKRV